MNVPTKCPFCGQPISANAPSGLCPACLLQAGLIDQLPPGEAATQPPAIPVPSGEVYELPPQRIAKLFPQLEILRLLGRGGMGAVYLARQKSLDRLVALKIIRPESEGIKDFEERFAREARAMARLSHPNIVGVHDFGSVEMGDADADADADSDSDAAATSNMYFLLMEYVEGTNLRHLIADKNLQPAEALAIVPQICEALQFAHDEGIVHRDIKPENILVDRHGRVKIADFGLAKLLAHSDTDPTLTGTHQIMGTPRYMAPEQLEQSRAIDHRADIYSLGVVFYEMLTGELPMGQFEPPSRKVQVDVRLDEVVLRSLAKEPERRYQHASEIKSDVESVSSAHCPPKSADDTLKPPVISETRGDRRSTTLLQAAYRTLIVGILVIAALLIAVGYGLITGGGQPPLITVVAVAPFPLALIVGSLVVIVVIKVVRLARDRPGQNTSQQERTSPGELTDRLVRRLATTLTVVAWLSIPGYFAFVIGLTIVFLGAGIFQPGLTVAGVILMASLYSLPLLAYLLIAVPIALIAAGRMRVFQSRGLAIAASVLVMLPLSLVAVAGIPVGIWSLIVLMREDVRRAFAESWVPVEKTRMQLRTAGFWLLISAVVSLVFWLGLMLYYIFTDPVQALLKRDLSSAPFERSLRDIWLDIGFIVASHAVPCILAALQIVGANKLRTLRSLTGSWYAIIIGLVPLSPGWLFSFPASIYAIAVMGQRTKGVTKAADLFTAATEAKKDTQSASRPIIDILLATVPLFVLIGFSIAVSGSGFPMAALFLPWIYFGYQYKKLEVRGEQKSLEVLFLVLAVVSLGLIGQAIWVENSAWPLAGLIPWFLGMLGGYETAEKKYGEKKDDTDESQSDGKSEEHDRAPEQKIETQFNRPANALIVLGVLNLLLAAVGIVGLSFYFERWGTSEFWREEFGSGWVGLLPSVLSAVFLLLGGICLKRRSSRALATVGAVAGLVPISPLWLFSAPLCFWVLTMLGRPEAIRSFVNGDQFAGGLNQKHDRAMKLVALPAVFQMLFGILNLLLGLITCIGYEFARHDQNSVSLFGWGISIEQEAWIGLIHLILGFFMLLGGFCMFLMRARPVAVFGASMAMLPLYIFWPFCAPLSAWTLSVLAKKDVKELFD